MDRLRSLMDRVKMVDLTPQEILALVAVFESADCLDLELHIRD